MNKRLTAFHISGNTSIRKTEQKNLSHVHLKKEIHYFQRYIDTFRTERKPGFADEIREELSRSSMFAAFKRKIVSDDPELSVIFADALNK